MAYEYKTPEQRRLEAEAEAPHILERNGQAAEREITNTARALAEVSQQVARLGTALRAAQARLQDLIARGYKTSEQRKQEQTVLDAQRAQIEAEARAKVEAERQRKLAEQEAVRKAEPVRIHVPLETCQKCGDKARTGSRYHVNASGWYCDRNNGWQVFMAFCQSKEQAQALLESGGDPSIVGLDGTLPEPKFSEPYDPARSRVMANPGALPITLDRTLG